MSEKSVTDAGGSPRAGLRQWLGMAVMSVAVFTLAMDMTVLFMALPEIGADLSPGATQMLWILHIGEFLAAGFVITFARIGERVGRRRMLMIGVGGYGLASLSAAMSATPEMLIASRALLGLTAATVMPSILSLLRIMFPDPRQFSVAVAVTLSGFSAGAAFGPPLAGLLLEYFSWQAVFLVNVPITLAIVAVAPLLLPENRDKSAGRPDFVSVLLSVAAMITTIFGLQELAANGLAVPYVVSVAVGLVLAVVFVRRQLRLDDPLMDMNLFRTPAFTVSVVALLVVLFSTSSEMLFVQHLQVGLGLSPLQAGSLMTIAALSAIAGTMLAPVLARRFRAAYVMGGGLAISAVGATVIALLANSASAFVLVAGIALITFGAGPTFALGSEMIVSSAPVERAGSAYAVQEVTSGLGFAIGLAFLGSLSSVVYRSALNASAPAGVPSDSMSVSEESAGGALGVAENLPAELREQMTEAIGTAFGLGVQTVYAVAVFALIAIAVMVVWRLRSTQIHDETPEPVEDREGTYA